MSGQIEPETFKHNRDLSSVDFSSNKLSSIPSSIFQSNFIIKVVRSCSQLKYMLHDDIVILQEVYFAENELEEIPEDLLQNNPEIVSIDFSRNKLREISKKTFRSNHMMMKASLARNRIIKVLSTPIRY